MRCDKTREIYIPAITLKFISIKDLKQQRRGSIIAANKGADLVIHPAAYETPCEVDGWWDKLYEASAMTNSVWVASANMAGQSKDGAKIFFGGSRIIDPTGNTVAEASYVTFEDQAASEVLVVEIDYAQGLANGKEWNGCLIDDRKVDVYHQNGL